MCSINCHKQVGSTLTSPQTPKCAKIFGNAGQCRVMGNSKEEHSELKLIPIDKGSTVQSLLSKPLQS